MENDQKRQADTQKNLNREFELQSDHNHNFIFLSIYKNYTRYTNDQNQSELEIQANYILIKNSYFKNNIKPNKKLHTIIKKIDKYKASDYIATINNIKNLNEKSRDIINRISKTYSYKEKTTFNNTYSLYEFNDNQEISDCGIFANTIDQSSGYEGIDLNLFPIGVPNPLVLYCKALQNSGLNFFHKNIMYLYLVSGRKVQMSCKKTNNQYIKFKY
ncbi:MAG: hypothetical protein N4A49_08785, partial [Marinifilaceae bacterium]|nr:hypothetical protein [Marinifilaceae bacterium]